MTPEGELKARCRRAAKENGLLFVNVEGKMYNGWPDSECGMYPAGSGILHVEFKRLGQRPTAQQAKRIREIRAAGGKATWVDNFDHWQRAVGLLSDSMTQIRHRQDGVYV